MFNIDLGRTAMALVGALLLTTISVGAAVGPARQAETSPALMAGVAAPVADRANV
jgi:hypothetical protein